MTCGEVGFLFCAANWNEPVFLTLSGGFWSMGFGVRGYRSRRPRKFVRFLFSGLIRPGNPALHTFPSSFVHFANARIQLASRGRKAQPYFMSIPEGDLFNHLPSLSAKSNVNKSKMALIDI